MVRKPLHLIKGKKAELRAARYLRNKGYSVIDQNKSYKFGEIDIIVEKAGQRAFVEVKYRKNNLHGNAAECIDARKQRRLTKSALCWIQEHDPEMNFAYRFDVIAIEGVHTEQQISWIPNAFEGNF